MLLKVQIRGLATVDYFLMLAQLAVCGSFC